LTASVAQPVEPQTLAGLLSRELRALESFVALLQREQSLLSAGDTEAVTTLAAEKSRAADELGQLAASRDSQLASMQLPVGRAGMDNWTTSDAGAAGLQDWKQLLQLASEARTLNEANGQLIALHLKHYQQGISVLMAAVDRTATYGPDGQQRLGVGGRSHGSA
jgi:flagella synthesis protein FlgN